ncbi:MAG: pyruvate, water dikinase regulatory protein [Wenzhouxiangellaceae bacterium]|nr:pyruvate, water dikinase regulatory protein [Wenzhouxiangellaceae bacterium]
MRRTVMFISDGTAITAQTFGQSLLTQFPDPELRSVRLPFVDSPQKAAEVVDLVNRTGQTDGVRPLVFSTIVNPAIGEVINRAEAEIFDMFSTFVPRLEQIFDRRGESVVGQAHGMADTHRYEDRMEATNYALAHDDGISRRLEAADVILIGVSRSGKTPTCLYLALHFGLKAANYPLTEEDLEKPRLPDFLRKHRSKLFGLSIDAERLSAIRQTRRPDSRYASIKQCRYEVEAAEALLRAEGVPMLSSTRSSVEELASRILLELGLNREHF